jgi:peptidoglycan/LPS O-acetylase OafA/YrhL
MNNNRFVGSPPQDMPALTGLRFVAAAYIVLLHQWRSFLPSYSNARYWDEFLSGGYIAVSFFFVLSGFILSAVYLRDGRWRRFDRAAFWQARFGRIYPAYALSMVLSAPFALIKFDDHSTLYHQFKAVFLTITNFSLIQAWHPALSGNWNRPSWSVSTEAFFYLLFPILGAWVVRRQQHALRIGVISWALAILSSVLCLLFVPNIGASFSRLEIFLFNPMLRLPEFMIGICCGVWSSRQKAPVLQRFLWLSMAACVVSIPLLVRLPWLLVSNGMLAPLFGVVIIGLSSSTGIARKVLGNRVMVHLGQASFSLYLLHFPVFFWMSYLAKHGAADRFSGEWSSPSDSPWLFAFYVTLCVLVSLASFAYIETPARRAVKIWLDRRAKRMITVPVETVPVRLVPEEVAG